MTFLLLAVLVLTNSFWISVKIEDDDELYDAGTTIAELETSYEAAMEVNEWLESRYDSLRSDLVALKSDLYFLEERYELYQRLRLQSLASDYYQTIREEVGPQSITWWYYNLDTWQNQVNFCASLARHNQAETYWPAFEYTYYEFYGSHSYDDALSTLQFVLEFIGVSGAEASANRMAKILEFLDEFVEYQPDMVDKYFAPVETLAYGSGDCDDYAILTAALFEVAGIDAAVGFFTDEAEVRGHAMTLVHMDDLDGNGFWYFSDLTDMGLTSGRWIVIEPRLLIDQQSSECISDWRLEVAADA